jgi:hypothetical protein
VRSREYLIEVNSRPTSGCFEPFVMIRGKGSGLDEFAHGFV